MKEKVVFELEFVEKELKDLGASTCAHAGFLCNWIETVNGYFADMKSSGLSVGYLSDIIDFASVRNAYLNKKTLIIDKYLLEIKKDLASLSILDESEDFVEIDSIDTKLRFMLISLGLEVPSEVFGDD